MVSHHVAEREMHQHEPQKRLNHLLGTLFDLQLVRLSKYESFVMHIYVPHACSQLRQLAYITLSTRGTKMPVPSMIYHITKHMAMCSNLHLTTTIFFSMVFIRNMIIGQEEKGCHHTLVNTAKQH